MASALSRSLNMHVKLSNITRWLTFGLSTQLWPFVDRAMFANEISTKISFKNNICLHEHCLLQIIARCLR